VTVAATSAKAITAYSFATPAATGTINENAKTIAVTVPHGTDVTALVATFTTTAASVKVGQTDQVSGKTTNDFTKPVTYIVTAADASTVNYTVTVSVAAASAKAITAYSFDGLVGAKGTIDEGKKTIAVTVPFGTDVTKLAATFTTSGASVKVGHTDQVSAKTTNDFTKPVTYTVTAADASTVNYTVTVSVAASSAKAITAYSFDGLDGATGTIDEGKKTIAVTVPFGTDVTKLAATFTTSGASVKVGQTDQVNGKTTNDFTKPVTYTVTAADASTVNYTVTVTVAANPAKAITAFSFADPRATGTIDEDKKTIAVTVPSGTVVTKLVAIFTTSGASVKVGATAQVSGSTPNDFANPVVYTVTAADSSTASYTVTVTIAAKSAKAITEYSFESIGGATGTIDEDKKTIAVTVPFKTDVTALVATFTTLGASVKVGSTDQVSAKTPNDFTNSVKYTVTAADSSTVDYTVTVTVAANPAKAITAYSFESIGATGTIDEDKKTIAVTVPFGTVVTKLVATFTTSGASVKVDQTDQVSGTTTNDFTKPVTYTVTAADASTVNYTVTVTVAHAENQITAFSFGVSETGAIDQAGKTIAVTVPHGTDVTKLKASFTASAGAIVSVGTTVQVSGETPNDFSKAVDYTVTGADNSHATYTVTVTIAQ
jgi:hypothetical protein